VRFTKLVAESFQAIRHAEVEFGPGLNILYGPNDLGKSTLATAIRAALLVMPSSSETSSFAPWYADATPRVSLTFVDDAGRYWKVSKAFGSSGMSTGAELSHSKDGVSFSLDCKGRQVEEKIRILLEWGIPAPGGKGGPRGLPTSFLANVLLGEQTDVGGILDKSLASDLDETGKLRLTHALATLAQDPLFKRVLDAAQFEVEQSFTATGKRKRGQGSKFTEAGQLVKRLQADLDGLQRQLTDSTGIEDTVNALREQRNRAHVRVADATAVLKTMRDCLAQTQVRDEARGRLDEARAALEVIDAHAARVGALSGDVEALNAKVRDQEQDMARALAACTAAEDAVRAAEEALRIATSEDGARERELRRAHLAEQSAELNAKRQTVQARRGAATAAIAACLETKDALAGNVASQAAMEIAKVELEGFLPRAKQAEADVELARAILAYGRWRAASMAAEDGAQAKQAAAKARSDADEKDAAGAALESEVRAIDEALTKRRAALPTEEQAKTLGRLERELEMAEAALGGGLSIALKPRTPVRIQAVLDRIPTVDEPKFASERVFEAERSVHVSVGDLVDIEITAGAADKRRAVESLRSRWSTEAVPVLAHAAMKSVTEVVTALAAIAKEAADGTERTKQAAQLRADARSLRERAADHDERATKLAGSISDLDARRDAIGATSVELLQTYFEKLGKAWESQAEALHAQKTNEAKAAQTQLATLEQAMTVAKYRASDSEQRAIKTVALSDAALAALESADPETLLRSTDEEMASLSRRELELAGALDGLAAEATGHVDSATRALERARAQVISAKQSYGSAIAAADAAKAELNARIGERNALRAQLDAMDRAGAMALCVQREEELGALPDSPAVSDADVANAELESAAATRDLELVREELHKSEGALSKVGGAAVRDEVDRVQDALKAARVREQDLEIDADAWKLLHDTLRTVENEEGAHLGRALEGPVAAKFGELTGGRYKNLRLDAKLQTESVDATSAAAAGADVLTALSVGTRDQLATLLRLTVADQLKTAIVLDDHLVHSDPERLAWFREVLTKTALNTQVIVFTCRAEDYVSRGDLPDATATRDLAGGTLRAVDMARVVKRWDGTSSQRPATTAMEHQPIVAPPSEPGPPARRPSARRQARS
jgi:hypothetical protein